DQHPALLRTVPGAVRCGDARLAAQQPPPRPHRFAEPGEERLDGGCADGPSRDDHELRHAPDAAQMGGRPGRRAARGRQPRGHRAVPGLGYEELSPAPEWTCLLPMLLDELATEYGELEPLMTHGLAAARYLEHELGRRDEDGLISGVLGDYLSPGSPGPARRTGA